MCTSSIEAVPITNLNCRTKSSEHVQDMRQSAISWSTIDGDQLPVVLFDSQGANGQGAEQLQWKHSSE